MRWECEDVVCVDVRVWNVRSVRVWSVRLCLQDGSGGLGTRLCQENDNRELED